MNLMLSAKRPTSISSAWLLGCHAALLPFGFLFFHDAWYGIGWGKLGGPLILLGTIIGTVCCSMVLWYGSWWQKLCVVPTAILFGSVLFLVLTRIVGMIGDLF